MFNTYALKLYRHFKSGKWHDFSSHRHMVVVESSSFHLRSFSNNKSKTILNIYRTFEDISCVKMLFANQNTPRWLILGIDSFICLCSIFLAYLLRFNFKIPEIELVYLPQVATYMLAVRFISFLLTKTYAGIVRYTSSSDSVKILVTVAIGSLAFVLTNVVTYYANTSKFFIPFSIIIIEFITTAFVLTAFRLLVKMAYLELAFPTREKRNVVIFGAGESGIISKRALDRDAGTKYKVLAFIDEDPAKIGKKLEGISIMGFDKLNSLLESNDIAHLILSIQNLNPRKKQSIVDSCLAHNTKVLNVPPMIKWINGELSFKQIKRVNIEDLLEREEIRLDVEKISHELAGKTIMITGAAGSIGSELVRQISNFQPKRILLVDQAETPLYHIELEFSDKAQFSKLDFIIADVCDEVRMRKIFEDQSPAIVYHAAAYKHVPMMENNACEAVRTNVEGTKILADLSVEFNVDKFIMISSDKAVNPTNVMGASKRIAEIYTQSLNQLNRTRFITTRFGNVLGSNGSAIPLFRKQIESGGPVTVTHPEVTRFFMTIPEACQLVLEAGTMGNGGEIYIFDMGQSVKIVDLAKKMIKLAGLSLGKDIQIVFTGLRPGEKLYEELLLDKENTLPTHHPQIMIAKVSDYDKAIVDQNISSLINVLNHEDDLSIVKKMKDIVPEFKSQNSLYEKLDEN
jgi:FlaA1/EpsC-like NDP-sugar epimerase